MMIAVRDGNQASSRLRSHSASCRPSSWNSGSLIIQRIQEQRCEDLILDRGRIVACSFSVTRHVDSGEEDNK